MNNFLFCRTTSSHILEVPPKNAICSSLPARAKDWKKGTITLFAKSTKPIRINPPSYGCTKKFEDVVYYESILGNPFEAPPLIQNSPVAEESCWRMIKSKVSPESKALERISDHMYATNDPVKLDYKGIFVWGYLQGSRHGPATNYLYEEIDLFVRPGTMTLFSPIYNLEHCHYPKGSCNSANYTFVWDVDCATIGCNTCSYREAGKYKGVYTQNMFYVKEKQLTLTFGEDPVESLDCKLQKIRISEQGFAILSSEYNEMHQWGEPPRRVPRGLTTEDLAAELTTEELLHLHTLEQIVGIMCNATQPMNRDPSKLARQLLSKTNIMATWRGPSLLEVFDCAPINQSQISMRRVNDCYRFLPVWVNTTVHDREIEAFLDPVSLLLSTTAATADCRIYQYHYLKQDGKYYKVNPQDYTKTIVEEADVMHAVIDPTNPHIFDMESFHDNIISNNTEVFEQILNSEHINELERINNFRTHTDYRDSKLARVLAVQPQSAVGAYMDYWLGWLRVLDFLWIHAVAICSTIIFLLILAACCLPPFLTRPVGLMGSGMQRAWEGTQAAVERRAELIAQREEERLTTELLRLPSPPTIEPPATPSSSQSPTRLSEERSGSQAPLLKTPSKGKATTIDTRKKVYFHKKPSAEDNPYVGESYVRIDDDISRQAPSARLPSFKRFFEK